MEKLVLRPDWKPLSGVIEIAPNKPGLYMMAIDHSIEYDRGISRIVYIGSSVKLRRRLISHYNNMKINVIDHATDGDADKVFSCFFPVEVETQDELLNIEQIALDEFVYKFGVIPIGNWNPKTMGLYEEVSFNKIMGIDEETGGIINFRESDFEGRAMTFDEIAEKYGLEYERDEYYPRVMFRVKGWQTPSEIAEWMLNKIEKQKVLYRKDAVLEIKKKFGKEFVKVNKKGGLSIDPRALARLRYLTTSRLTKRKSVIWEPKKQCWRYQK